MKSISWQSIASWKLAKTVFTIAVVLFWTACSDSSQNVGPNTNAGAKGSSKSTSNFGDYNIALSTSSDGAIWTYTITKNPGAKNLSHFILNLDNCGDQSPTINDILWATVNGGPATLADSEGQGTTCYPQATTNNFVKFDNLGAADSYVIVIKFDRGYQVANTTGWLKAGTSCNSGAVQGPGCPIAALCSMSQGYYFAKGSWQNGADDVWTNGGGVTLGGNTYTHAEGAAIWNANTGRGSNGNIRAFFQYSAIKLSGTDYSQDADLLAAMTTIENYFSTRPKITASPNNFLTTNSSNAYGADALYNAQAAAGFIGNWICNHHCSNNGDDPSYTSGCTN